MLVPELKIPTANARSFFGNHSATVFKLAGKTPASPNPNANRAAANPASDPASPCAIDAKLQNAIASEYPSRVPNLSINRPDHHHPQRTRRLKRKHQIAVINLIPTQILL